MSEKARDALREIEPNVWELPASGAMRVPGRIFASRELVDALDEKVREQVANVATLPGIVRASFAMPDAHWGYGFPIGGVAAFDPDRGGVVSAGGVGFDISCGVRTFTTGMKVSDLGDRVEALAHDLYRTIPAGVGAGGAVELTMPELDGVLAGGARWAVGAGWGGPEDLARIEDGGCVEGAEPDRVSRRARERQLHEVGSLGSGNHYLEIQRVETIFDPEAARAFRLAEGDVAVSIHCGSRGLGHQIGTEFLQRFVPAAARHGISLPDRELACAPIRSRDGEEYLGAMRAAMNCALANRQVLGALVRRVFARHVPGAKLELLYDVSHNTCKAERHEVDGKTRLLFVHRKGATRAFGPGHPDLPAEFRSIGQPVLVGGTMGTASWILVGTKESERRAFGSSCHGAGRRMSRTQAKARWKGGELIRELAGRGILIKSHTAKGAAEEAPGAYKDVDEVAAAAEAAGLSRRVARLVPLACIKG
jgi:tRNA-splicing ligase RtcB